MTRLGVAVTAAMQAWDATVTAMAEMKPPETVAAAALTAMQMTADAWGFQAPDAVEAVMLKIVSRTPLTFTADPPFRGCPPQAWLLLSLIRDSSPDHQEPGELASKIWKLVKEVRVAQTGSSSYVTEVSGRLKSMQEAMQAWQQHYKRRDRCEMRTHTVSDALKDTQQELEELRVEVGRTEKVGLEATKLAVMDEAGDVWYGAQCYIMAYREQCQQAVGAWARKARVARVQRQVVQQVWARAQRRARVHQVRREAR